MTAPQGQVTPQNVDFTPALREVREGASPYIPQRRPRLQPVPGPVVVPGADAPPRPMTDQISENAARYYTMVLNLQESEMQAKERVHKLEAKIDEMNGTIADLRSQLETSRLETKQANERESVQRSESIRLAVAIENMIVAGTEALRQPE